MVYVGVWLMGCAWPPIGDAEDIGDAGGSPAGMFPGFHMFGDMFIIGPFPAAIVFNNWGSDIVVNSSHATPGSIG
jgi:hypothetical protein